MLARVAETPRTSRPGSHSSSPATGSGRALRRRYVCAAPTTSPTAWTIASVSLERRSSRSSGATPPRELSRSGRGQSAGSVCVGSQLARWWLSLSARGSQPDGSPVAPSGGRVEERRSEPRASPIRPHQQRDPQPRWQALAQAKQASRPASRANEGALPDGANAGVGLKPPPRSGRPADAWVASAALFRHGTGEPELGEHAAVGEEGDLGDVAAREREHHQPIGARDLGVRAGEVAAEGGLTVGPGRDEPQWRPAARAAVAEEAADRLRRPGIRRGRAASSARRRR